MECNVGGVQLAVQADAADLWGRTRGLFFCFTFVITAAPHQVSLYRNHKNHGAVLNPDLRFSFSAVNQFYRGGRPVINGAAASVGDETVISKRTGQTCFGFFFFLLV